MWRRIISVIMRFELIVNVIKMVVGIVVEELVEQNSRGGCVYRGSAAQISVELGNSLELNFLNTYSQWLIFIDVVQTLESRGLSLDQLKERPRYVELTFLSYGMSQLNVGYDTNPEATLLLRSERVYDSYLFLDIRVLEMAELWFLCPFV